MGKGKSSRKTKTAGPVGRVLGVVGGVGLVGAAFWLNAHPVDATKVDPATVRGLDLPGFDVAGATSDAARVGVRVAVVGVVLVVAGWGLWRWHRRRVEWVQDTADALGVASSTDTLKVKLRVRRWRHGFPTKGTGHYASFFDADEGGKGREAVQAVVNRLVGKVPLVWDTRRRTYRWDATVPVPEPTVVAGEVATADHETVVARLVTGLTAAMGSEVEVAVTAWHDGNVPQSFRVLFPASARVHEDKLRDGVEDKVRDLLPGTWQAQWYPHSDEVRFTDRPDALAPIVAPLPLRETTDLRALPVGLREDGTPWLLRLVQTHVLLAGATGAGKGSVLWGTIRAVAPGVAAGTVVVWGIDPKAMELARGRGAFARYAVDADESLALLEAAVAFMDARARRLGAARVRDFVASPGDPFLIIVIDEIASLTKYGADRKQQAAVNAALGRLLSMGRAVGVCVVGALQDPRKEVLTIRDLFPTRIALRLVEANACDMVLGFGARAAGARADRIPVEQPGGGYMLIDGQPTPTRFRAAWVDDDEIDRVVALCHRPAPPEPVVPPEPDVWDVADADDLAAGLAEGRVQWIQDDDTELRVVGVVESPDEDGTFEVEVQPADPDGVAFVVYADKDTVWKRRFE